MKILIIQPWISYRGAETVSVEECFNLNKLGTGAKIACLFLDSRLPENAGKVSYLLPSRFWQNLLKKSKIAFYLFSLPVLTYVILKNIKDFDILNPHNPPSLWAAQIVGIPLGKKIIWTLHNVFPFQLPLGAKKIITPTKKMAGVVKNLYSRESEVIYNGI